MVKQAPTEEVLLETGLRSIQERLPPRWSVEWVDYGSAGEPDRRLTLKSPNGSGQGFLVEAKRSLSPKDVAAVFGPGLLKRLRAASGGTPILVVAPFISLRSQELLADQNISYVDMGGNVRLVLDNPALFIQTSGTAKNPYAPQRPGRGLRGAKAGVIIRTLIDASPPYTVSEIAATASVGPGYVSRVLETLEREALITRGPRGTVTNVDWSELIRRRASALDLLVAQTSKLYVSPNGARNALAAIASTKERALVTGSFAAVRLSAIAAPTLLVAYSMRPDDVASDLRLKPVGEGADVALIRPENPGVFRGARDDDGIPWAAPSQVAIDCFSGPGRMPSEGQGVIEWMATNEGLWRAPSLDKLTGPPKWAPT